MKWARSEIPADKLFLKSKDKSRILYLTDFNKGKGYTGLQVMRVPFIKLQFCKNTTYRSIYIKYNQHSPLRFGKFLVYKS